MYQNNKGDNLEFKKIEIKEGDKEMDVFIPQDPKDKSYNEYLEQAEVEKTKDQLRKRPPKPKSKVSKEEVSGELKERAEFDRRRKSDHPRKYY